MHYIYDFDGTLFSTETLWGAWVDTLIPFDIPRDRIIEEGEKLFNTAFTLDAHVQALGISDNDSERIIKSFFKLTKDKAPELIFSDVIPFLDDHYDEHKQSVLTRGDADYQAQKIELCGIVDRLEDIRIARPEKGKVEHLREIIELGSDPVVFIDDNPSELEAVHKAGLPVTLIRVRRDGERHDYEHEHDDDLWQCVAALDEVE